MSQIEYNVHPKETFYFGIKILACLILYPALFYGVRMLFSDNLPPQIKSMFMIYGSTIILFLAFRMGLLIGYLRNNAVKINEQQLPDIYAIVKRQAEALGMARIPQVYLLQAGGLLNAFATRYLGRNYIVIYSDILEEAYEDNLEAVEFIIGHELGHVKRKHILKRTLLFPSIFIPFLNAAYSRGCEYTCDSIGAALSPRGAINGLVLLASGKKLYKKVSTEGFIAQAKSERGFWSWFSEKISTHPKLTRRVSKFQGEEFAPDLELKPIFVETADHSNYFPKN